MGCSPECVVSRVKFVILEKTRVQVQILGLRNVRILADRDKLATNGLQGCLQ